jgi:hypothetical protein
MFLFSGWRLHWRNSSSLDARAMQEKQGFPWWLDRQVMNNVRSTSLTEGDNAVVATDLTGSQMIPDSRRDVEFK